MNDGRRDEKMYETLMEAIATQIQNCPPSGINEVCSAEIVRASEIFGLTLTSLYFEPTSMKIGDKFQFEFEAGVEAEDGGVFDFGYRVGAEIISIQKTGRA